MIDSITRFLIGDPPDARRVDWLSLWTPRVFAVAFVSIVVFCLGSALAHRKALVEQASAQCERSLTVSKEHVARIVEDASRTLRTIDAWMIAHPLTDYTKAPELAGLAEAMNIDTAQTRAVGIIDERGMATLLDRANVGKHFDVSKRPYFPVGLGAEFNRVVLGPPLVNVNTGQETISVLYKRHQGASGALILATAFSVDRVRSALQAIAGPTTAITLRTSAFPLLSVPAEGVAALGDDVTQCSATLQDFDIAIDAAVDRSKYLAEWRAAIVIGALVLTMLGLGCAALTVAMVAALRELSRDTLKLNELLAQAREADQAKATFLATMSHELRTPLNAIMGFSESMRLGIFGPLGHPKYEKYCEDIRFAAETLVRTYDDVLVASKANSFDVEVDRDIVDTAALLSDAARLLQPLAQAHGITIEMKSGAAPRFGLDGEKISRVVRNLVENSIKYCKPGNTVTVSAEPDGQDLRLEVADDGPGLSSDQQKNLFVLFYRAESTAFKSSRSGIGLGLWMVRKIVEAHGGKVQIVTAPGQGFRTICRIPPG